MTTCPHCAAPNETSSAFCTTCGKALPDAVRTAPRVVSEAGFADSTVGRVLQSESLDRRARSSVRIMAWIGYPYLAMGIFKLLMALVSASNDPELQQYANMILVDAAIYLIIGIGFLILRAWAGSAPLPATLTALVVYTSLSIIYLSRFDFTMHNGWIVRVILFKCAVIGCLAKSLHAGVKFRALNNVFAPTA